MTQVVVTGADGKKPIVDKGLADMLPNFTAAPPNPGTLLEHESGSTLICWDAEGLWGREKDANGNRLFDDNSILSRMGYPYAVEQFKKLSKEQGGGVPDRGARVYIFTPRDVEVTGVAGFDGSVWDVIPDPTNAEREVYIERAIITIGAGGKETTTHPNTIYDPPAVSGSCGRSEWYEATSARLFRIWSGSEVAAAVPAVVLAKWGCLK